MILSTYSDQNGNRATLEMEHDENFFPLLYRVKTNAKTPIYYPNTKRGAREAHKYYENYVSIYSHSDHYIKE